MFDNKLKVAGIILCGGKARRLGGADKGAIVIGDKTCFERSRDVLIPHVDQLAISIANGAPQDYAKTFTLIPDWPSHVDRPGVAFAILGIISWAKDKGFEAIITSPVDTPFLPLDYANRLKTAFQQKAPVLCQSVSGQHGLNAIWPVSCATALRELILKQDVLKIQSLHTALGSEVCDFTSGESDPFLNLNTPEDIKAAVKRATV